MAPETYAAEDGLVGYQREERPSVLESLNAAVWGNADRKVGECVFWDVYQERGQHLKVNKEYIQ